MAVRNFTNNNSELRVPIITASNITTDWTVAALVKPNTHADWQAIMAGHTSAGAYQWEFGLRPNDKLVWYSVNGAAEHFLDTPVVSTTTQWYLLAATRSASASRFHLFPLGGAWTHTAAASAFGTPSSTSGGYISFGEANDVDDLNCLLAVAGIWNSALSDAQIEALATNSKTEDWTGHAVAPSGVWDFNQATATDDVPDLEAAHATITGTISGSTDLNGIAGTAIVTGDDPPSWVFGAGSAAAVIPQLLMAPRIAP